jgi:hypothetical protein
MDKIGSRVVGLPAGRDVPTAGFVVGIVCHRD